MFNNIDLWLINNRNNFTVSIYIHKLNFTILKYFINFLTVTSLFYKKYNTLF